MPLDLLLARTRWCLALWIIALASSIPAAAEPIRYIFNQQKFSQAIALLEAGKLQQADAVFEEILAKDPGQAAATLGRAQIAVAEDRLADAERAVDATLTRSPDLPEAHNMKGVVSMLRRRPGQARASFERAIALRPGYVTPILYLATLARAEGDYRDAVARYSALVDAAPRLPAGHLGRAEAQMMLHQAPEALKTLEDWKAVPGSGALPYQVLANVYLAEKQPKRAVQELETALTKEPGNSLTLTYLGDAYAISGDAGRAAETYRTAIEADPSNADAAVRLGDLHVKAGRMAEALVQYRAAAKANPQHAVANNNAAWLLAERQGDLDEAVRLAEAAVGSAPQYVDGLDTLGWIRYKRGEYAEAITALTRARKLDAGRADIALHLGLAYAKAGQRTNALAELRAALARHPTAPEREEIERTIAELTRKS